MKHKNNHTTKDVVRYHCLMEVEEAKLMTSAQHMGGWDPE